MFRGKSQLVAVFFLVFYSVGLLYADNGVLSKNSAFEILSDHIKYGHFPVSLNTNTYSRIKDDKRFNFMHNVLLKLKRKGLVNFSVKNQILTKVLEAHLTPEGENMPHAISGFDRNMIGFVCGERTIFEINKVESGSGYVYFTYSFLPNELGYYLGSTKDEKNEGRAKIIFDSLHGRYVFKGFEYYSVKAGRWVPTSWFNQEQDKSVFYFGIIK